MNTGQISCFCEKRTIVKPLLCHKLFILCDMKRLRIRLDVFVCDVYVPVFCLFAKCVCFVLYIRVSTCEMYDKESFFQMIVCMFYEYIDMFYFSVGLSVKMPNQVNVQCIDLYWPTCL